jgi:hypothetical protein
LQISGNSNLPAYRNGDAIIAFPKATVMRGRRTRQQIRRSLELMQEWN